MRFLIVSLSVCLLLSSFGNGENNRGGGRGRNRGGSPASYQKPGWRTWGGNNDNNNEEFAEFEQVSQGGGMREWNRIPPPSQSPPELPSSSELIDENAGDIQQSQNFDVEDFSNFDLPPKGAATTPKYGWGVPKRTTKKGFSGTTTEDETYLLSSSTTPLPPKYEEAQPEVTSGAGTFLGKKIITGAGKTVIAFLGIPFAKPPVGDLRFKKPVPIGKLETPYDATHLPNACYQESAEVFPGFSGEVIWNPNTNVSEDCLYLNIWIPEEAFNNKEKELVPTMMWIYGGGLFSGSASLDVYNGAVLASEENIVVVSTQYRLGPQGFLFLGTEDAPGNMGMWDQNLALRWINENIDDFGGNPNAVTLFGESCGAASVGYHLLSPHSKIYFKRAVMASGLPGEDYSFVHPNVLRQRSRKLAKFAGCDIKKKDDEIMECLRNVDPATITRLQWRFYKKILVFPFVVTLDGNFLPDFPSHLLLNGEAKRTEVIMGTVQDEGSYFLLYQYLKYMHHTQPTSVSKERFQDIMKEIFQDYGDNEQEAIISYYTNWRNPEDGYVNQALISEAVGDGYFICPMRRWADSWSNRGLKVYYFHLTDRPSVSEWAKWMGVMHGDDIFYYFGHPLNDTDNYTRKEQVLSAYFMRLYANFAKLGIPSDKWERYTAEMPVYLDLNATLTSDTTVDTNLGPKPDRCAFWNRILPKVDKRRKPGNNRNTHWKNKKNRNNNWNKFDTMPMTNKGQEFDQVLPYPEMGWRGQVPPPPPTHQSYHHMGGHGQGQQHCMMPPTMHNFHHQHHQGIHGGQGFQMNPMQQQQQCAPQPNYCHQPPVPSTGGNLYPTNTPPPPEENVPFGRTENSPGFITTTTTAGPIDNNKVSCKSCCDETSTTQSTPVESEFDEDEDYSEANSFWPKH